MRIEYTIDRQKNLIRCQASGGFHLFAFANYLERIMHDPQFHPQLDALVIAMDESTVPGVRTRAAIAQMIIVWSERRRGCRWAIVLPSEASKQKAEEVLVDLGVTSVDAGFFTSEGEALNWLAQPKKTPACLPIGDAEI